MRLHEPKHSRVSLLVALFSTCLFWCLVPQTRAADDRPPSSESQGRERSTAQTVTPVKAEIVVTPERGPVQRNEVAAAVTVLTRAQIEALPAQSLDEVIGFIPGVTMYFDNLAAGAPMISARGFFGGGEVEYVKLLVDGVPAGDVESGLIDWRHLRVAGIERIEVLRGPGSSLYGDTAMGGVIEVFTRQRDVGNDTESGEVRLSSGSFGTHAGDVLFRRDAGPLRIGLSVLDTTTDGYREHARARDRGGDLSLQYLGAASRLSFSASFASKDREEPGELTAAEAAADPRASEGAYHFDRERTDRRRVVLGYDSFGPTSLRALLHGDGRTTDFPRTFPLAPGFVSTLFRHLESDGVGGVFEVAHDWQSASVRAGSDLDRATLHETYADVTATGGRGVQVAAAGVRRDQASAFVTADWIPFARLRIASGLRWDDIRDGYGGGNAHRSAWSPRLGATLQLGSGPAPLALFVQLARAFKAPTLDQLFDPRPFPGETGAVTVSNPSLLPQRAHNVEIGISRNLPSAAWSLSAYDMKVTDEIDFDPTTFVYGNIGSSRHRGVEAMGDWQRGVVQPEVLYTWTRVTSADNPGQQLKNIPEHVVQLLLRTTLPGAVGMTLRGRWERGRFADDAGAFPLSDVRTVDAKVSRTFGRLRAEVEALNLFDERYAYIGSILADFRGNPTLLEFPAPGRAVRATLAWRY